MRGRFTAMASDCELLVDSGDDKLVQQLCRIVATEAWRIEQKFSRYRDDNVIHQIHSAQGRAVSVDAETAGMLDFAARCHQLSDGLFDISSGILRSAWVFDGSDRIPSQAEVDALLPRVGWSRIEWRSPVIRLPEGMQIDFGGFGKEYAVDSAARLVTAHLQQQQQAAPFLINFGGDLFAAEPPAGKEGWIVGVADVDGDEQSAAVTLTRGGLATSGDARRFLQRDGRRYSHVLDPRTGWPVANTPAAVTVAAHNCTEAGFLATLAMLHGRDAHAFLKAQSVPFLIQRRRGCNADLYSGRYGL